MTEEKRPLQISIPFNVRTYDVDFAQIVHNAVYIRWLEDLRTELLADYYSVEEMLADNISPILTRTEIDYLWPVRLGDAVTGNMWVSNLSRIKWIVQAEMWVGEQKVVASTQFGYFLDQKTLRPIRVPAKLQAVWSSAWSLYTTQNPSS